MLKNITKALVLSFIMWSSIVSCSDAKEDTQKSNINKLSSEIVAPDFSLKDLNGVAHSLNNYKGKVVFLNFTTTWCPYCKKELPNLKKMYSENKDKGFEIIAIYLRESQQKVSSFASDHDLPYKILLDTDGAIARTYGVRGVPTHVLVGRDGKVYCYACPNLESILGELLKEKQ